MSCRPLRINLLVARLKGVYGVYGVYGVLCNKQGGGIAFYGGLHQYLFIPRQSKKR